MSHQLIIPRCGHVYCPWEDFRSIVLSVIDVHCLQEPLKTSMASYLPRTEKKTDDSEPQFSEENLEVVISTIALFSFVMFFVYVMVSSSIYGNKMLSPSLLDASHRNSNCNIRSRHRFSSLRSYQQDDPESEDIFHNDTEEVSLELSSY